MYRGLLCLVLLLSGCAGVTTVEVSAGYEFAGPWVDLPDGLEPWVGDGPVVEAAIRHTYDNGAFVEYRHTSSLLSGEPFNDRLENSLDRVSVGKIFRINALSKGK